MVQEALDLAEVACHRHDLATEALLHRLADLRRQRRLERQRGHSERLDLLPRAPQRGLEPTFLVPALARFGDPPLCPFQCLFIHARKATVAIG